MSVPTTVLASILYTKHNDTLTRKLSHALQSQASDNGESFSSDFGPFFRVRKSEFHAVAVSGKPRFLK